MVAETVFQSGRMNPVTAPVPHTQDHPGGQFKSLWHRGMRRSLLMYPADPLGGDMWGKMWCLCSRSLSATGRDTKCPGEWVVRGVRATSFIPCYNRISVVRKPCSRISLATLSSQLWPERTTALQWPILRGKEFSVFTLN